jgi:(S)-ureidoglycine aminohydrolase
MKNLFLASIILSGLSVAAQIDTVESKVYTWNNLKAIKQDNWEKRKIVVGSGSVLAYMEWDAITIDPGNSSHPPQKHDDEEYIIIKEGELKITLNDSSKVLGPGSFALFIPGDQHGIVNVGNTDATYYVFRYRSKAPVDMDRARKAGGSFLVDWNAIEFRPHGRGGIRNFFERPTAMLRRFEMHVTTLNGGIKSHEPHTHEAEENVLLVKGNTEMQIAQTHQKAVDGDLIYLSSNILHAIENKGSQPATYFAFQWQ